MILGRLIVRNQLIAAEQIFKMNFNTKLLAALLMNPERKILF